MSYTDTLLASGERILRRSRQHWFVMVWNARWAVIAIIAAVALLILRLVVGGESTILDILGYVTLVLFLVGLIVIAWGWIRYQNEEFVITSRRIIHVSGVINKKATDSSLEMINDAVLTESVFGRMFGFGDLEVLTASEAGIESLHMLTDAKSFKKAMIEAKHELALEMERPTMPAIRTTDAPAPGPGAAPTPAASESRPAPAEWGTTSAAAAAPPPAPPVVPPVAASAEPPAAAVTGDEVTDALDRLGDLRDKGIVTPEEFEAKKKELLDRL
jgi:Bacterial PH domain/Short C-terminal domain